MAGSLGVFIVADLLTFYLVYALVSVPAYYLVAHDEEPASLRAGGVYMAFALLGEAILLIAFVMLAAGEPHSSVQIHDVVAALPTSPWRDAALALIIVGFGMKIALVPLHGWMPLTYTAAPIPAAAVLSGAAVKAGVIGLIRFLPLGAAFTGWGEALVWLGFISAFYGVAVGVTQRDPKTMLAYSSVSQMGVIAAAFGMALASAHQGAATNVAFYAANHVLVKAALFLTVGVVAMLEGRARTLALIVAALLGLSLAGLPLTGGALAKLAVKELFGDGATGVASQLSAAATTALMLLFVMRHVSLPASKQVEGSRRPLWSWAALAVAARLLIPLAHVSCGRQRSRGARTCKALGRDLADAGRRRAGRWSVGGAGSASSHSRRRHRRRRRGRVPRLTLPRAHVGASRPGRATVARSGPCNAHDRARARRMRDGRSGKALTLAGELAARLRTKPKRLSAVPGEIPQRQASRSRSAPSPRWRLRGQSQILRCLSAGPLL